MIKIFEIGFPEGSAWDVSDTKYGTFIMRDGLPQQIRVGEGVTVTDITTEKKQLVDDIPLIETTVQFGRKVSFSAEPKSMNVGVSNCGNMADMMTDAGEVLVVVRINLDLAMVRYRTNYDLMNTFHNTRTGATEKYYGGMIVVPRKEYDAKKEVLRVQMKTRDGFRFMRITQDALSTSVIKDEKVLRGLASDWKKRKERCAFFHVTENGVRTSFLIGRKKDLTDEIVGEINEKWTHPKNTEDLRVFLVPDNINPEGPPKRLMKTLEEELNKRPKTRAITVYNGAISFEALKSLKLLYIFGMDDHGTVKTLRSN